MIKFFRWFVLLAMPVLLWACGSGGGGGAIPGGTPDTTAPAIVSTFPVNNATGVSQSAVLRVTFDRDINCSSVTDATFTLVDSGNNAVTGAAACSGPQAAFTPAAALSPGEAYTATVAPVKGANGNSSEGMSLTFTTNSAAKMPVIFTGLITNRWVKAVGADAAGNVIMVYLRDKGTGQYVVSAQRYNKAAGTWGGHTDLATTDISPSAPIKLAVNKNGDAVAMWNGWSSDHTYYNYYNHVNATWSGRAYVSQEPSVGSVLDFDAAIDESGNVMASWSVYKNDGNHQLFARYYPKTTGVWKSIKDISAVDYPHNLNPRFAFDAAGSGMIVLWKWRPIWDGSTQSMVSSMTYSTASDTWNDLVDIAEGMHPDIGISASGKAVAVWIKKFHWDDPLDPPAHDYYGLGSATRADSAGAWNNVFVGAGWDPKGNASNPRLTVNASGDAMVAWTFWRGAGHFYNINAAYMASDATDWSQAGFDLTPRADDHYAGWRVVDGDGHGADANTPQLILDANGNGTLVYSQSDGTRSNVYSMTYTRPTDSIAGSWSEPREIDATYSDATGPMVAVDGTGVAITVWNQVNPAIADINDFWFLRQ